MNRLLLSLRGAVALLLIAGGIIHALGFPKAMEVVTASGLTPFLIGNFKLLWFADSANLIATGTLAAYLTIRPGAATRFIVVLASIPVALTGLMSVVWMPGFFAGPLLLGSAGLLAVSALGAPRLEGSVA